MRAIRRLFNGKLIPSDLHLRRHFKMVVNQECRLSHSKLHTMVCHRMKLYPVLNAHFNTEEEDGFEMVRVRAPPGASESTAPGHIEWEKTVGSRVAVGEVVCRIRFKEDRSLDIKSPVAGTMAVRRKNEGDSVAHGDELFKIRLDAKQNLKSTTKKKRSKSNRDYYEEEEEIVGQGGLIDKSPKLAVTGWKSSFIDSNSDEEPSQVPENYRKEMPITDRTIKKPQEPQELGDTGSHIDPYKRDMVQTRTGLIPSPYSQPMVVPISQLMTTINEINMQDTVEFINKHAGDYEAKYGNKPCLRSMYIRTAAHALKLNKELNIKIINDERVESKDLEITIAIRHLKVMVFHTVKNIHKMSYVEISRLIYEIEKQIAAGTYKTHKGERGFTISPEWEIGSMIGTPVHSKTCTLGLHKIVNRPIFVENKIVAYPMMYASLTYDKKLIDDEAAIEYLRCFKESMEDPRHILVQSS